MGRHTCTLEQISFTVGTEKGGPGDRATGEPENPGIRGLVRGGGCEGFGDESHAEAEDIHKLGKIALGFRLKGG